MVVGKSTVWIWDLRRALNSWLRLNRLSSIFSLGSSAYQSNALHKQSCRQTTCQASTWLLQLTVTCIRPSSDGALYKHTGSTQWRTRK